MSIVTNILTGGSNNHQTTSENANQVQTDFVPEGVVGAITNTAGVAPATGAFAVNAQGSPNMTVAVSTGVGYVTATPSGQSSQSLRIYNNASSNVTIAANASGSTKYDWVYISVSAANAANPNTAGDNVATLVTSRSSNATSDDGTPPAYGYPLAVVTVANAASSITNGNIADKREQTGVTTTGNSISTGAIELGKASNTVTTVITAGAAAVLVCGKAVTIPSGGRDVEIVGYIPNITDGGAAVGTVKLWDGTVGSGTELQKCQQKWQGSDQHFAYVYATVTAPAAGSKTYNMSIECTSANLQYNVSSTDPATIVIKAI